jgi:hypothetical protein
MYAIQKTVLLFNRGTIVAVFFIAVTACLSVAAAADDNNAFRQNAKYMKYVGTYYTDNGQTVTINSDGTQTTVGANMFSVLPESGTLRATPAQGVWRKVGQNQIQITNIRFWTDASGNDYRPNGSIMKATFIALFDKPVGGQSLGFTVEPDTILLEFFNPDQNPITDEPFAAGPGGAGYKAYRLQTVQPGS